MAVHDGVGVRLTTRIAPTIAGFALVALCAAALGVGIGRTGPSQSAILIVLIALSLAAPIVHRLVTRTADVFEPLVIANAAFLAMYVLRPYGLVATGGTPLFRGYDVSAHFNEALLAALIGVVGFQLGYAAPWARHIALRLSPDRRVWNTARTVNCAVVLAALGVALFSLFLVQSGGLGLITDFLAGRSGGQYQLYRDSTAYLYGAPQLLWPAALILVFLGVMHRRPWIFAVAIAIMAILGVYAGAQGSRLLLLPLFSAPFVFLYLYRGKRPGAIASLIIFYLIFTVGVAYFRESRDTTREISRVSQLGESLSDPLYEYRQLVFEGADNDMFESLTATMTVVPSELKPNPVRFVVATLAKPIPSLLWSSKPLAPEERLTQTLYPSQFSKIRASSSAGILGSMFLAGLLPGVFVGMLLIGAVVRVPWEFYRANPRAAHAQLLFAASLVYIPILLRGGLGDTLARLFFGLLPLLIIVKLCTTRMPTNSAGYRALEP
jgi:hypothetical protein